ncbi:hypothetical protein FKM82_031222 [Ascaphus truei]
MICVMVKGLPPVYLSHGNQHKPRALHKSQLKYLISILKPLRLFFVMFFKQSYLFLDSQIRQVTSCPGISKTGMETDAVPAPLIAASEAVHHLMGMISV